jgi:transcriptional regulator with XRE-family HTH domain
MLFAEKLRRLRDAAGLSEAKLAEKSGLTFASVHGYGLGRRSPSFAAVVKLARALSVTCEAFADCEDMVEAAEDTPAVRKTRQRRSRK